MVDKHCFYISIVCYYSCIGSKNSALREVCQATNIDNMKRTSLVSLDNLIIIQHLPLYFLCLTLLSNTLAKPEHDTRLMDQGWDICPPLSHLVYYLAYSIDSGLQVAANIFSIICLFV